MSEAVQSILSSRLFSTRGGTMALGGFVALLALILLLVYLSHYRSSVKSSSAPVPVLVAKRLIKQGTSGDAIASTGGFVATTVPRGELQIGAVTDTGVLRGLVAAHDIFPKEQLTSADFTPTTAAGLSSRLAGNQRAISLPIDSVHGLLGQVVAGDRIDIFADIDGVVKPIVQNVYVLGLSGGAATAAIGAQTSTGTTYLTLRMWAREAGRVALASDIGKVWVVLRPATGARPTNPSSASASNISGSTVVPQGH